MNKKVMCYWSLYTDLDMDILVIKYMDALIMLIISKKYVL